MYKVIEELLKDRNLFGKNCIEIHDAASGLCIEENVADCGAEDDVAEDDVAEDDDSEDELGMIMLTPWQLISKATTFYGAKGFYPNSLYVKGMWIQTGTVRRNFQQY